MSYSHVVEVFQDLFTEATVTQAGEICDGFVGVSVIMDDIAYICYRDIEPSEQYNELTPAITSWSINVIDQQWETVDFKRFADRDDLMVFMAAKYLEFVKSIES